VQLGRRHPDQLSGPDYHQRPLNLICSPIYDPIYDEL
jgi:hypothetical protein